MSATIFNEYQSIVVHIATPYTVGTGFYLSDQALVVTNEHIVRDNKTVVIDHLSFGKQLAEVIFLDAKRDLALLQVSKPFSTPTIQLLSGTLLKEGQKVYALGGMGRGKSQEEEGVIIQAIHEIDGIPYFMHDATLSTGDSGGPLFNESGLLIGVNTFVRKGGQMVGLSLPVQYLKTALENIRLGNGKTACCCFQCGTLVFDDSPQGNNCPNCRETIQLPSLILVYQPIGVAATIEELLSETIQEIELSRRGPNCWQIQQGSAEINISYYEKNGLIVGDAHLCELPSTDNEALFAFLLRQNFEIENLTFSIKGRDIVLSLMIYDRYLNDATGRTLFLYLFEQADAFDNILVEEYGAVWRISS